MMRMTPRTRLIAWSVMLLVVIAATSIPAQEIAIAPPNAAAATTEAGQEAGGVEHKSLFGMIRDGGVLMIPLIVCSFVTLVFAFERAISLRRGRVIPSPFVKRFMHELREGKLDRDEALELCQESNSPISDVFVAAVRKWGRPSVEIEQSVLDAEERAAFGLRRYVRLFNAVATLGPLLGLLGTVLGMISIFNEINQSDAMGNSKMLAGGISEAMITTATGLFVAIPAMCFYMFFGSRVERLSADIDDHCQELINMISAEALQEDRKSRARTKNTAA